MADDSFLTDSDDERAVEDLLSQAKDLSVLEQIATINCSSFSNSDHLPPDLENRFRKLKSLPTATASAGSGFPPSKSKSFTTQSGNSLDINDRNLASSNSVDFERSPDLKKRSEHSSPSDGDRDERKVTDSKISKPKSLKSKSKPRTSNSVDFEHSPDLKKSSEHSSPSDGDRDDRKVTNSKISKPKSLKSKSKPRNGSSESRSETWSSPESESESGSVSPVRRRGIGCLWCSPKKEKRKQAKGKENWLSSSSSWGNDYDVEFVKTFSMKEQKRIMKKAMKEEEKINREAEKIVKWAKQASARMMEVSGIIDDELTDLEDTR